MLRFPAAHTAAAMWLLFARAPPMLAQRLAGFST
eukprot:gene31814-2526_t